MKSRINIKSEREFFREVFDKIVKGEYAIPIFQRDFVWKSKQVEEFFDSIWRGYPIGSILLWQPDTGMPVKDILTDEMRDEPRPSYFVLDGRQRLSAFFGCVSKSANKRKEFDLYFNLETEAFTHTRNDGPAFIKLSEVYDTFALLDKMKDLGGKIPDDQKLRRYIDNAKRLNSILQGYTVSEVYINNCSLKEAEVVFSRINSKGTGISNTYMLQATSYRKGEVLFTDRIKEIQESLAIYGFKAIASEDLLKCFYKYADKYFYDAKPDDLEHMDFGGQTPKIKDCIVRSVAFLHDECHVLDLKLLPYMNQLIAMTWFFKDHQNADSTQQKELRRWFYYTSYCQIFMNGSLKNIRKVFRRFESYVKGIEKTAIDYEPVKMDSSYHFTFSLRNARTDFVVMACIYERMMSVGGAISFSGIYNVKKGNEPLYGFVCFSESDKQYLGQLFGEQLSMLDKNTKYDGYALDEQMISIYQDGNFKRFEQMRKSKLISLERNLLISADVEVGNMQEPLTWSEMDDTTIKEATNADIDEIFDRDVIFEGN